MESTWQNNDISAIKDARKLFNEIRSNLSREEIKGIGEKLHKNDAAFDSLKEKEQKGSLTNEEKKVLKNIDRHLKNISMHFRNLKKHFKKDQYDLGYLFNEHNEDYTTEPAIEEARKLFNERRSNLLCKETNEIRKNIIKRKQFIIF